MRTAALWGLAIALLSASAAAVTARSLFRAVYALAGALMATAGLYLLLSAPLLAAVQILLYTGGVLTLIVFALVVAGRNDESARWRSPVAAGSLAFAVFGVLAAASRTVVSGAPAGSLANGRGTGVLLFMDYLVPFELLSVLLLGAVLGALLVARKDRPE
jgi:NADH-quinone oxidoreductase subunit J